MTIEQLYEQAIKPLAATERMELARLILSEIPPAPSDLPAEEPPTQKRKRTPAEILAEIAAMPIEAVDQMSGGRDHDRILYGGKGAR